MANDGSSRSSAGRMLFRLLITLIIVGLMAGGGYLFMRYQAVRKQQADLQTKNTELSKQLAAYKADPNHAAQVDDDNIIAEVGKLYALPTGEKPIVTKIPDKEAYKKQYGSFFDNADNNDVSLIYTKAKLAILYRPSTQKIINVSSVTIQDPKNTPAPAP